MSDEEKPSRLMSIVKALREWGTGKPDPEMGVRSVEAEAISKELPAAVMPRGAIEKKRQQLRDLDKLMGE